MSALRRLGAWLRAVLLPKPAPCPGCGQHTDQGICQRCSAW